MNKNRIKQLNKRIDEIISKTKQFTFPLYGGLSDGLLLHNLTRQTTFREAETLQNMNLPVPICIALDREKEFLDLLESGSINV